MQKLNDLRCLLEAGGDPNAKDRFGTTAIHYAVSSKFLDGALLLLRHGADARVQDKDGYTALHYAVAQKQLNMLEVLLQACPEAVNVADKQGNGPLWLAAHNARHTYDFVDLLLRYHANPRQRNECGTTPVYIAERAKDPELMRRLIPAGGTTDEIKPPMSH